MGNTFGNRSSSGRGPGTAPTSGPARVQPPTPAPKAGNRVQSPASLPPHELDPYCEPTGLYDAKKCKWQEGAFRKRELMRLIRERKLAPRVVGLEDAIPKGPETTAECPVCFFNYVEAYAINRTTCCKALICSECYLHAQTPDYAAPCVFCQSAGMKVIYTGDPSPLFADEKAVNGAPLLKNGPEGVVEGASKAAAETPASSGDRPTDSSVASGAIDASLGVLLNPASSKDAPVLGADGLSLNPPGAADQKPSLGDAEVTAKPTIVRTSPHKRLPPASTTPATPGAPTSSAPISIATPASANASASARSTGIKAVGFSPEQREELARGGVVFASVEDREKLAREVEEQRARARTEEEAEALSASLSSSSSAHRRAPSSFPSSSSASASSASASALRNREEALAAAAARLELLFQIIGENRGPSSSSAAAAPASSTGAAASSSSGASVSASSAAAAPPLSIFSGLASLFSGNASGPAAAAAAPSSSSSSAAARTGGTSRAIDDLEDLDDDDDDDSDGESRSGGRSAALGGSRGGGGSGSDRAMVSLEQALAMAFGFAPPSRGLSAPSARFGAASGSAAAGRGDDTDDDDDDDDDSELMAQANAALEDDMDPLERVMMRRAILASLKEERKNKRKQEKEKKAKEAEDAAAASSGATAASGISGPGVAAPTTSISSAPVTSAATPAVPGVAAEKPPGAHAAGDGDDEDDDEAGGSTAARPAVGRGSHPRRGSNDSGLSEASSVDSEVRLAMRLSLEDH